MYFTIKRYQFIKFHFYANFNEFLKIYLLYKILMFLTIKIILSFVKF